MWPLLWPTALTRTHCCDKRTHETTRDQPLGLGVATRVRGCPVHGAVRPGRDGEKSQTTGRDARGTLANRTEWNRKTGVMRLREAP